MTEINADKTQITLEMQVAFYDVDAYRVVWHGNYPKYFEIARCKLLEKIGFTYNDMEEINHFFPVIDMKIKYVDSLFFDQHFSITASLKEWQNKLVIDYHIRDSQSQKSITKAQTTQVAVKMPERIIQFEAPKALREKMSQLLSESC